MGLPKGGPMDLLQSRLGSELSHLSWLAACPVGHSQPKPWFGVFVFSLPTVLETLAVALGGLRGIKRGRWISAVNL